MKNNSQIRSDILKKSEEAAEQEKRKRFSNRYYLIALMLAIVIAICGIIDHVNAGHLFDIFTKYGAAIIFLWVCLMYLIPFKPKQNVKLN